MRFLLLPLVSDEFWLWSEVIHQYLWLEVWVRIQSRFQRSRFCRVWKRIQRNELIFVAMFGTLRFLGSRLSWSEMGIRFWFWWFGSVTDSGLSAYSELLTSWKFRKVFKDETNLTGPLLTRLQKNLELWTKPALVPELGSGTRTLLLIRYREKNRFWTEVFRLEESSGGTFSFWSGWVSLDPSRRVLLARARVNWFLWERRRERWRRGFLVLV